MRSLAAVVPFEYERFQCVFVLQHLLVHTDGLENRASEDNVHWLDKCLRAGFVRSFVRSSLSSRSQRFRQQMLHYDSRNNCVVRVGKITNERGEQGTNSS